MTFSPDQLHALLTATGLLAFASQPLAVHAPSLLQDYATGRLRIDLTARTAPAAETAAPADAHPNALQLVPSLGLAIQPVRGVIVSGAGALDEKYSGLFNLDHIHAAAARVAADPAIKTLILQMDTPGGSVFGLHAAAGALSGLTAARRDVTTLTYAQRLCASAGMYLAAATQQIHASPGAVVGSIGTVASLTDSSGLWNRLGLTKHIFTADSTLKALGHGGAPVPPEHLAHMEETVRKYSAEFKSWMAERRGLTPADMLGQVFEARHAPEGMVDSASLPTFEEFLAAGLPL